MTISRIIKSFSRRGYLLYHRFNGVLVVDLHGSSRVFPSFRAAYLHYQKIH